MINLSSISLIEGKNVHFVEKTADVNSVVLGTLRSAFEYSGQKCSACSRLFIPESLWPEIRDGLTKLSKEVKVGDVKFNYFFESNEIV